MACDLYEINNFKRQYTCTEVRFIEVLDSNTKPPTNYTKCDARRLDETKVTSLWVMGNYRYYGYL